MTFRNTKKHRTPSPVPGGAAARKSAFGGLSTSKHFDLVAIIAMVLALAITGGVVWAGAALASEQETGEVSTGHEMGYESRLFDTSYVHSINIEMDNWDSFISQAENEEYSACTITIDGESYPTTAIRAKGNTSLQNVAEMGSERYSFKVEFDHFNDQLSYYGLDKLCLNNLIQDATMMKDYLTYTMMGSFGVDAPLCSYAYITVNGEDWGLYLAVESVEDAFLERNYGSDTGELYKPDSMSFGGGRGNGKNFDMSDFDGTDTDSGTSTEGASQSDNTAGQSGQSGSMGGGQSGSMGGSMPEMPSGNGSTNGGQGGQSGDTNAMGGSQNGGFTPDNMGNMGGGQDSSGNMGNMGGGQDSGGNMGNMGGGQGGMGSQGSSDVKLQYIDDNISSYSNIFDNAKTSVSGADKTHLIASLKDLSNYTNLTSVLDTDEVLRYFVVHNFVCNDDSYTGTMVHNYYLRELDGELSMIPWDYNLAFGTFTGSDASGEVNTSIDAPVSDESVDNRPMVGWIFSNSTYTTQYHKLFAQFISEWFTSGKADSLIAQTAEMLAPYVESDPTRFFTVDEFNAGVEALRTFVSLRAQAVSQQLAGDTSLVDTGDLNLSDMGTMNSGRGNVGGGGGMGDMSALAEQFGGEMSGGQGGTMPNMPSGGGKTR